MTCKTEIAIKKLAKRMYKNVLKHIDIGGSAPIGELIGRDVKLSASDYAAVTKGIVESLLLDEGYSVTIYNKGDDITVIVNDIEESKLKRDIIMGYPAYTKE